LPLARLGIAVLLVQIFLIPILRLLPIFVGSAARLVYFFAIFCALNAIVDILDLDPLPKRKTVLILFGTASAVLAWWGRPARLFRRLTQCWGSRRELLVVRWSLGLLALILAANVFGFVLLSNLLRVAGVLSAYIGLVIWTLVKVASTLLAAMSRSPRLRS